MCRSFTVVLAFAYVWADTAHGQHLCHLDIMYTYCTLPFLPQQIPQEINTRIIDINRTPFGRTRPLSSYQLTHDKVMQTWTSDMHAAARQKPTGGPVFILYSTQSSSYIYRYTVLVKDYYYIAI